MGPDLIALVPMTIADARELAARDDDASTERVSVPRPPPLAQVADWVAAAEHGREADASHLFAVRARGVAVGATRLGIVARDRGIAQLSYWILPAERGRGYATAAAQQTLAAAFGVLALARIQTFVDEHNAQSRAVLVRAGFGLTGRFTDGRLCYERQKAPGHG